MDKVEDSPNLFGKFNLSPQINQKNDALLHNLLSVHHVLNDTDHHKL